MDFCYECSTIWQFVMYKKVYNCLCKLSAHFVTFSVKKIPKKLYLFLAVTINHYINALYFLSLNLNNEFYTCEHWGTDDDSLNVPSAVSVNSITRWSTWSGSSVTMVPMTSLISVFSLILLPLNLSSMTRSNTSGASFWSRTWNWNVAFA